VFQSPDSPLNDCRRISSFRELEIRVHVMGVGV